MTSRINSKSNPKAPDAPPTTANPYAPSVPISLYREVAAELQSAKTNLESLKLQNQELTHQNQQLRLEIERVVQSALHLRQTADSFQSTRSTPAAESPLPGVELHFDTLPTHKQPTEPVRSGGGVAPEPPKAPTKPPKQFTEQPAQQRRKIQSEERSNDLEGWWLVLAVLFIVVTAFGTGFLIVRPLLPSR